MDDDFITKEVEEAYVPKGNGPFATHPLFREIIDRLLSGWTFRTIERWLLEQEIDPFLTQQELRSYAERHISASLFQRENYMRRIYGLRATVVDEINEAGVLLLAQLDRVSDLLEREAIGRSKNLIEQGDDGEIIIDPDLEGIAPRRDVLREIELAGKLALQLNAMKVKAGVPRIATPEPQPLSEYNEQLALPETTSPQKTERLLRLADLLGEMEAEEPLKVPGT